MMMSNNKTESDSASADDGVTLNVYIGVTTFFIEASAIILANLLTIITFSINRHLRKKSMYCVINLAVADMLFGIEELLSSAVLWKMHDDIESVFIKDQDNLDQNSMLWRISLTTFVAAGTMLSLALVAVERMYATVWPLRHRNARPWAYTLAFSMTWTATAVSGLLIAIVMSGAISSDEIPNTFFGLAIVLVVVVICVSYIMIFIKVKQQQQQMAGQRVSRRDQRLAMTLFIVTVASFGAWIPLALFTVLKSMDVINFSYDVHGAVSLLAFSNSLINPIIYVFRMKDFRKALLCLIIKCSRHRPTQVVPHPIANG